MEETRLTYNQLTDIGGTATRSQSRDSSIVPDTSFVSKTHAEKADILNKLLAGTSVDPESPITNVGHMSPTMIESVPATNGLYTNGISSAHKISRPATKSITYIEIMRAQYMTEILQFLRKVQTQAAMPTASVYVHRILQTIQKLEEQSPNDPILEVLLAFYDALAFKGLWATYTAEQYQLAEKMLLRLVNQPVNAQKIEKAITALDAAGFVILPYSFSADEEEEF